MKTKKILLGALAVVLTIALSIAATVAYLTDVDSEENIFTIGNVDIDLLEYERIDTETANADAEVQEFHDNKPLLPAVIEKGFDYTPGETYVDWEQIGKEAGYTSPIWNPEKINNEVDKMVFVENTGDYSAYVRIYFAFEAGNYATFERFQEMIHINLNDTSSEWVWEWIPFLATNDEDGKYFIAKATYQKELAPDAITEISLSQIALDPTATNEHVSAFGDTYEVCVNTQAIQSAGFGDPDTALDEGFGEDIPFADLKLVTGIDLRTALHNLNGDDSNPITANVATVTFGFNKDHADVVANYEGTLTSVEQEAEVYTYYVPNETDNTKYDVYVLADDTIYTPKISQDLFRNMTELTSVDTTNMDVSRTENMNGFLRNCKKLTVIDTSNWNTEKVTDMSYLFQACNTLPSVDVSGWNTENVTSFYYTFSRCYVLATPDVSGWETGKATTMERMFNMCHLIPSLDVSNWDTSGVTTMSYMFYECHSLSSLDVSDWDTSNVTDMSYTFKGCHALTSLDISEWDVGNVTTFESFLSSSNSHTGDMMLESVDVSKWDTSSATNMKWMFYGCEKITELDLSAKPEIGAWDVSKVTNMYHMFTDCFNLTTLNMKGWNTESLTSINGLFNSCESLKVIDVSDFDTQNVTDMSQVFESCYSLEEIIGLDKWDTSNVTTMCEMFSSNPGYGVSNHLTELDLSSFDTSKVTDMRYMFQSSPDLVTIYVGDGWSTENVTDSTDMFKKCPSIVGEKGTTFDSELFDMTYAHVDGGTENPGYFTYKAAVENTNP